MEISDSTANTSGAASLISPSLTTEPSAHLLVADVIRSYLLHFESSNSQTSLGPNAESDLQYVDSVAHELVDRFDVLPCDSTLWQNTLATPGTPPPRDPNPPPAPHPAAPCSPRQDTPSLSPRPRPILDPSAIPLPRLQQILKRRPVHAGAPAQGIRSRSEIIETEPGTGTGRGGYLHDRRRVGKSERVCGGLYAATTGTALELFGLQFKGLHVLIDALEEELGAAQMEELLPAAAWWIFEAGRGLREQRQPTVAQGWLQSQRPGERWPWTPGPLYSGPDYFHMERWVFWETRFLAISQREDLNEATRKLALDAHNEMKRLDEEAGDGPLGPLPKIKK
ncbi:MAG: hypothetical protein M1831_001673 [Alyxoria varia]|nr:MAG: hypothetical protein M1831_001673 [Alyxoria varia]